LTRVAFTVHGVAAPGGSKRAIRTRTGRTVVIDDCKRNPAWRSSVASAAAGQMVGRYPMLGAIELDVTFHMPRPKAHYRKDGSLKPDAPEWHEVRPDATKLLRALEDAMSGIVWGDDSQVVRQSVRKVYANEGGPRVDVTATEIVP
jgi:Holliday junction resolvase RusA-like endonuclease